MGPLRTTLRRMSPALRAVDHIAWWVSWQSRPAAGGGTRTAADEGGTA